MAAKKTIAIVGATEKSGTALAQRLAGLNNRLLLLSTDSHTLNKLSHTIKETQTKAEIEVIDCLKDGCWEADIIFIAVPNEDIQEVAEKIKEVATQKIVVCISNYESETLFPFSSAQQCQQLLPYSKIVTAFKNSASATETFIAGDDLEAVETISHIVKEAGLNPVLADNLSMIKTL